MFTKTLTLLAVTIVCSAYPHQEHSHPQSGTLQPTSGHHPVPLGPQPLNQEEHSKPEKDLSTDASTWWKSWGRWGNSYGYNHNANPVYYTTKTHYVYTPRTYTYYAPETYSTYWSEPSTHVSWSQPSTHVSWSEPSTHVSWSEPSNYQASWSEPRGHASWSEPRGHSSW